MIFTYGRKNFNLSNIAFNRWDLLILALVISVIFMMASGSHEMTQPYVLGETIAISLDPTNLPNYGLQTVERMFIALFFSLLVSFILGMLAARSEEAERIIIPLIDILQSVPVLGFLSITVVGFIHLFPGSLMGPECAAIFAIFTAQVWNMALSVYQSFVNVPQDLVEVSRMYHLSAWQRFWRVELPYSIPGLVWNTMMSMSGSWFFVVACEAITVSNKNITLPGIGSYIALAISQANLWAILYATITMLMIILIYDQLFFRPILKWAEKFRLGGMDDTITMQSWVYRVMKRARFLEILNQWLHHIATSFIDLSLFNRGTLLPQVKLPSQVNQLFVYTLNVLLTIGCLVLLLKGVYFIYDALSFPEIAHAFLLGAYTLFRITVVLVIASLVWVPVGIYVGLRPNLTAFVQPIAQFLAGFPANLLFPFFVVIMLRYGLNVEIWTAPLLMLGAQWYILFNVIAGASVIPKDVLDSAEIFHVKKWLWWSRVSLPAIFPYFVTGAFTAAGGSWNASIVAEVVTWGSTTLTATGLGSYIAQSTAEGNYPRIALGIAVMSIYVVTLNRAFWHKLYVYSKNRFRMDL